MKRIARASTIIHGYGGEEDEHNRGEDRLSSLPDVLLIHILCFIDAKFAVQTSTLSKRWVNIWTMLPVLNFDSCLFKEKKNYTRDNFEYKVSFDDFINHVLAFRNKAIKVDYLTIKATNHQLMSRVLNFSLVNCIPNVSMDTSENLSKFHPLSCLQQNDSLESLKVKGMLNFGKFPVFTGLKTLILERVKIVVCEPFSCFPNLENLCLVNCKLSVDVLHSVLPNGEQSPCPVLQVIAPRLSRFTISSCFYHPIPYERILLLTPSLVSFELDGLIPMMFDTEELPLLETIYIDCCFSFLRVNDNVHQPDECEQKINLVKILRCLGNAKSVHLSPSTVKLLSLMAPDLLLQEPCPFGNLKFLNLVPPPNKPVKIPSFVGSYLLKDCPRAVVSALPR